MIGQVISHYNILEKLGEGGMGVVYKALDTKLDRIVALKFLPSHLTASGSDNYRFILEAKAVAALNHPNISTIHSVDEHNGNQFIVMEYISGCTLYKKLKSGRLSHDKIINYCIQITEALKEAHSQSIIHRDIKSGNIMVTTGDRIKVMDFGLAKLKGSVRITLPGNKVGTISCMSPEQIKGEQVDERSDIWSFGVVLYEMLTGRLPFKDDYEHAVMYSILNEDPIPLSELDNTILSDLEQIVFRCLAKDPANRFQSASELYNAFMVLKKEKKPVTDESGNLINMKDTWKRISKRQSVIVVYLAIIMSLFFVAQNVLDRMVLADENTASVPSESIRLTVLPFKNLGEDTSRQIFCDGLSETITSSLSQIGQFHQELWVIPAEEVRELGITSPSQVFKTLGVNYAVTGSLQPIADMLRLTINLVDVKNLRQVNSVVIDGDGSNIPALYDKSVEKVLSMLNVEFKSETRKIVKSGQSLVSPAFEHYLEGIGYLQRYDRIENINNAVESFKKAVSLDPGFALAYAGLGEAFLRKYDYARELTWLEMANEQVQSALQINSELSQANVTMGMINSKFGRYEEAIKNFNNVFEVDPMNAGAYRELARAFESTGDIAQAQSTIQRAIQLKPEYWSGHNILGAIYLHHNQFEKAIHKFEKVIELTPDNYIGYMNLGITYFLLNRNDEAQAMFERSLELEETYDASSNLATLYFSQGMYKKAARMFETALEISEGDYRLWGNLGAAYYWAPGEREKAGSAYNHAIKLAKEQEEINPNDPYINIDLAGYSAFAGKNEESRRYMQRALDMAPGNSWIMFSAGTTFERLGEREEALYWIGKAIEHDHSLSEIMAQPDLQELISDKRFEEIAGKL